MYCSFHFEVDNLFIFFINALLLFCKYFYLLSFFNREGSSKVVRLFALNLE